MLLLVGLVFLLSLPWLCLRPQGSQRRVLGVLSICALLIYAYQGAYRQQQQYTYWQAHPAKRQTLLATLSDPKRLIRLLQHQCQQHPTDQHARQLLAEAYLREGAYFEAYQQVNQLPMTTLRVQLIRLEAKLSGKTLKFSQQDAKKLASLVEQYPNHVPVLTLAAAWQAHQKHWDKAVALWRQLAGLLPPGSQAWKMNNRAIEYGLSQR